MITEFFLIYQFVSEYFIIQQPQPRHRVRGRVDRIFCPLYICFELIIAQNHTTPIWWIIYKKESVELISVYQNGGCGKTLRE